MTGKGIALEISKVLSDYYKEVNQDLEDATDEIAEDFKKSMQTYTNSRGWKNYAKKFIVKKYGHIKYVGNTMNAGKTKIPLSNILEHGATRKHRGVSAPMPHFRIVFDARETSYLNKIEKKIGGN